MYPTFLVSVIFFFCSIAQASWNFEGDTAIYGQNIEGDRARSTLAGLSLSIGTEKKFFKTLTLDAKVGAIFETGSNQSIDSDEFAPDQQVVLHRAEVRFEPIKYFFVEFGALSRKGQTAPLFLNHSVFAGIREGFKYAFDEYYSIYLMAEQSIPNNQTLSERLGSVDQGTPQLMMETIGADLDGDLVALYFKFSHFRFQELSSGLANQSRFFGNSATGIGPDGVDFDFKFDGYHSQLKLVGFMDEEMQLSLDAQYTWNNQTPDSRSAAWWSELALQFGLFKFGLGVYRAESDATIAFYQDPLFGHSNRKGYHLNFGMNEIGEEKRSLIVQVVKTKEIEENAFQAPQTSIFLKVNQPFSF